MMRQPRLRYIKQVLVYFQCEKLKDYENVVPEINHKVKEILLNGMKKAGLE
mgnify:CR=1 FL=1